LRCLLTVSDPFGLRSTLTRRSNARRASVIGDDAAFVILRSALPSCDRKDAEPELTTDATDITDVGTGLMKLPIRIWPQEAQAAQEREVRRERGGHAASDRCRAGDPVWRWAHLPIGGSANGMPRPCALARVDGRDQPSPKRYGRQAARATLQASRARAGRYRQSGDAPSVDPGKSLSWIFAGPDGLFPTPRPPG
jgi:hypothetical protein